MTKYQNSKKNHEGFAKRAKSYGQSLHYFKEKNLLNYDNGPKK